MRTVFWRHWLLEVPGESSGHAVRKNAGPSAGALEGADDMQQVGVVALLGGWHAEGLEALEGVVQRIEAGAPALVGKGRSWRPAGGPA